MLYETRILVKVEWMGIIYRAIGRTALKSYRLRGLHRMKELKEHKAYQMLEKNYKECLLDYVILLSDRTYLGQDTHKEAVIEAFHILNQRKRVANHLGFHCTIEEEKMSAIKCDISEFLKLPTDSYYDTKLGNYRSYWSAFLEPPYDVSYVTDDFKKLNYVLFPFLDSLEIYQWNDDFSNYFDDGKEWWGTGCWSAYDKITNIFVVIGASLSD